jgi:alpha-amylase
MTREGQANGATVKLTKGLTLAAGSSILEIAYLLENLPPEQTFHFGVEFNLAGLPAGADDRFYYQGDSENQLGQLGTCLDLQDVDQLGLIDQWLGVDVGWSTDRAAQLWAFPIETVSQSEGGFEAVHQSVVLLPHWHVQGDATGRWAVTMKLQIDTSLAESRMHNLNSIQNQESLVS